GWRSSAYLKRALTCSLAWVRELAGALPETTASMAGSMMPLTLAVLSVMGYRNVVLSLTCSVNAVTSTPLALKASAALSEDALSAGNTTALEATTSWQSADARYSTHLMAASFFWVPAQMESARPLNIDARSPSGPTGVGAMPTSMPLYPVYWPVIQEPWALMADLPAAKVSAMAA